MTPLSAVRSLSSPRFSVPRRGHYEGGLGQAVPDRGDSSNARAVLCEGAYGDTIDGNLSVLNFESANSPRPKYGGFVVLGHRQLQTLRIAKHTVVSKSFKHMFVVMKPIS